MPSREIRRYISKKKEEPGRKKAGPRKKPVLFFFSIILLLIIVISFIGAPIVGRMTRGTRLVFGMYEGKEITYIPGNYMAEQYSEIAERVRQADQSSNLESQLWMAWREAFNKTVFHFAVMSTAEKSGLFVSDEKVTDSLLDYGPYLANGIFSHKKYKATPRAERNSISKLRREQLIEDRYIEDLFYDGTQSSRELEFIKDMAQRERSFSFVSYDFNDFPEESVVSYGLANREFFEKIKLSRITITSGKREAEKIRDLALEGQGSFEDLARSYSKGLYADKGGDMDWKYFHELKILFENDEPVRQLFALEQGDISSVLESGNSWIFFRCDAEPVSPDFEDQDLLNEVRRYVMSNERGVVETYFMEEADRFKLSAEEIGFNKACLEDGLFPPHDTEYFPINYADIFPQKGMRLRGQQESFVPTASHNETLFLKFFSLAEGEISDPILLSDHIIVAKLLNEREAPTENVDSLEKSLTYLQLLSLEKDIQYILIDEEKLVDNFQEAFYSYIVSQ